MQNITPKEAEEKIKNGAIVIDVRTPAEYMGGHIAGSRNMDISNPNILNSFLPMPKDKEYVIYCQSGGRSSTASKMLAGLGFSKVFNLLGGITAWAKENLPTDK